MKDLISGSKLYLIHRKEQWSLTVYGWLFTLILILVLILFTVTNIYPFLAVNAPISADVLVVEGWIPDYAIKGAIAEFKRGHYRQVITTGTPVSKGYYLAEYKNFAELTAATFIALGFDNNHLVAIPTPYTLKNRTYASAVAVRQWLSTSDLTVKSINLYTSGPHARRSWIIFKSALTPTIKVGVIAAEPQEYNFKAWWQSSEGVRTVIGEAIAYIYARFFNCKS